MLFILAAVLLGFFLRYSKLPTLVNTVVAIALLFICIIVGLELPIYISASSWHILVFVYIAIASVTPVWALLQPRDYLNSYLLIAMIVSAVLGVVVANPDMNLVPFNGFVVNNQPLFPILFITIACGAVSGFHSLVSSGTASKQIQKESHMLPVSFGAMLLESLLAVIALIAVGAISSGSEIASGTPSTVFATAISSFLAKLKIPSGISFTLINLAVSAFALTSLDSVARVGRIAFQEFFMDSDSDEKHQKLFIKFLTNKYTATVITLAGAYALAKIGYQSIWPLFGSANQLLSALALITCAAFLKRTKRKSWMLWIPMSIMLLVTLTALSITMYSKFSALISGASASVSGDILQAGFAFVLFILAITVAVQGVKKIFS